jgi:hypothetical protein
LRLALRARGAFYSHPRTHTYTHRCTYTLTLTRSHSYSRTHSITHSQGVVSDLDDSVYVADTLTCQLRRVASARVTANNLTCNTRLVDVVRPLGCAAYDTPSDVLDEMVRGGKGSDRGSDIVGAGERKGKGTGARGQGREKGRGRWEGQ